MTRKLTVGFLEAQSHMYLLKMGFDGTSSQGNVFRIAAWVRVAAEDVGG